jgi:hypothetical protein
MVFSSRGAKGPRNIRGNAASIKAHNLKLIEKYGLEAARKHPDWKSVSQGPKAKPKASLAERSKQRESWKNQVAELVSEGYSLTASARTIGINPKTAFKLWREICAELGETT